ncbi:MAG: hypothetical protein EAZ89_14340, partial [Bacteroidetes bacterium]
MKKALPIFLLTLSLLHSCGFRPGEGLSWDTEALIPLAYTEAGVMDFAPDTLLTTDGTGLLRIVYRDTISSDPASELVTFPDTSISLNIKLDTLTLNSDTIKRIITLGELARQLKASGNIFGDIILANHGGTLPVFPGSTGLSSGAIAVDASSFFEFAELKAGTLSLTISNYLPLDLSDVIFEISNANLAGPPLLRDTFPQILKNGNESENYDLAGKQVESSLEAQLVNLDIDAGLFIPIDTNDYREVKLVATGMRARTATAIFPAQVIIDTVRNTLYTF